MHLKLSSRNTHLMEITWNSEYSTSNSSSIGTAESWAITCRQGLLSGARWGWCWVMHWPCTIDGDGATWMCHVRSIFTKNHLAAMCLKCEILSPIQTNGAGTINPRQTHAKRFQLIGDATRTETDGQAGGQTDLLGFLLAPLVSSNVTARNMYVWLLLHPCVCVCVGVSVYV